MNNIYVFAFATFGHPNDFRQSAFIYDHQLFAQNIKTFDLTNAIKVMPDSTIYAIRKELVNETIGISYSIYTFAKEQQSFRDGAFIGSSITYSNGVAEEKITIAKLLYFHKELIRNNTNNNILTVNHSKDFNIPTSVTLAFEAIDSNLKDIDSIDNFLNSNNNLIIYSNIDENTLSNNFKDSLELLDKYDTIYFTDNKSVIDYSRQRRIYSVSDENGFRNELINAQNIQKEKNKEFIFFLAGEKQKWKEETNSVISIQRNQIENNERLHHENEIFIKESIKSFEKIPNFYSNFEKIIDNCIQDLSLGEKLGKVKKSYNENKNIFLSKINGQKNPYDINKFNSLERNIKSQIDIPVVSINPESDDCARNKDHRQNHNDKSLIMILFGGIVLVVIIFYGMWHSWHSYDIQSDQEYMLQGEQNKQVELNTNDLKIAQITPFPLHNISFFDSDVPGLHFNGIVRNSLIFFDGTVTSRGGGMVLKDRIPLNEAKKIIITVKGSSTPGNIFSDNRLFKIEIDNKIAKTSNIDDRCIADNDYIISKDGEYEFPLSQNIIYQKYIERFQITFYQCTIKNLSIRVSLQ